MHYDDLAGRPASVEMRRIADFLDIDISDAELARMAGSASFEWMRKNAEILIPEMAKNFEGGALRLVNKGQSGRWRGLYDEADVELFDRKLREAVPDAYADWLLVGRIVEAASILRRCELSLGRRQAFLDSVRDELRGAWVDAVQLGKVERGEVSDHCEVHQHGERRAAFSRAPNGPEPCRSNSSQADRCAD